MVLVMHWHHDIDELCVYLIYQRVSTLIRVPCLCDNRIESSAPTRIMSRSRRLWMQRNRLRRRENRLWLLENCTTAVLSPSICSSDVLGSQQPLAGVSCLCSGRSGQEPTPPLGYKRPGLARNQRWACDVAKLVYQRTRKRFSSVHLARNTASALAQSKFGPVCIFHIFTT
jgi:hypothetical protein